MGVSTFDVIQVVQSVFSSFEAPIFMALTLMMSFAVACGIKRIMLE